MDDRDDMIVLVVVDDEDENSQEMNMEPKSSEDSLEVNSLIEMAKIHGEFVTTIKSEPPENDDWGRQEDLMQNDIKSETFYDCLEDTDNSQHHIEDLYNPELDEVSEPLVKADLEESLAKEELKDPLAVDESEICTQRKKCHMPKPWERRSFVAELTKEYPDLRDDEELLVYTLEQIMRSVKPPPPPRDYYILNGIMLECRTCGNMSETIPAASRHYQEKHGQRYLVCYACGVDFRSTTNLYKHEKRCNAPDASIVLKARAAFLGRKGRSRPYLRSTSPNKNRNPKTSKKTRFPCKLCSAVFMSRYTLQSHENLHRGERPYRCAVCPCAYTSNSALSRHNMKHTDVQYICDHCKRSFKSKTALVTHMDTHRPLRKHGCSECSRRFAQKAALILHVNRVHRKLPPPCACQICPKRYPRMSLLKEHMKRAHGMTIITRKMFFKSLPTMTDMEIKQSKVVLKASKDVVGTERPYNTEEMFKQCKPENINPNINNNMKKNDDIHQLSERNHHSSLVYSSEEVNSDKATKDFMSYVKVDTAGLGDNVVYIENGEVVERFQSTSESFILNVEALSEDC